MQPQFIIPNFHVILIHYPLALIGVGLLIELFAFLWRRSTFRVAGRWMLLLGILSLVPAATSGLQAMSEVNRTSETVSSPWMEARATSPVQGHAWELMKEHAWFNAAGTAVFLLVMVLWLGSSDTWRARLHFPLLFVMVVGMAIIISAAWHGGEMVYRHGVSVNKDAPIPEPGERDITYYVPPLQVHVILAGYAIAVGFAAIGLSLRSGAVVGAEVTRELSDIGAALNAGVRPVTETSSIGYADDSPVRVTVVRQPVARFWLIAALLGITTAATGWWFLAHEMETRDIGTLWKTVADTSDGSRRLVHTVTGVVIVLWMILMALVSRLAAGRKFVMSLCSLLLVLAVVAQLWFGGLLMLDSAVGNPLQLNSHQSSAPTTTEPATTTTSMR